MQRSNDSGFTLIELLITLTVLGIISSFAIPSYTKFMTQTRLSTQNTELMLDFNNNTSCSNAGWGAGRIVFVDAGTAGSIDGNDEILKVSAAIASQDSMLGDQPDIFISYQATGVASKNISITTCQSGYKGAKVTIYPSGRISKDTAGTCS